MESTVVTKIKSSWRQAHQWFYATPERSLDQAYNAALAIKAIEDKHFGGHKITEKPSDYGNNVIDYFKADLNKYLNLTKIRLAEFKASRVFVSPYEENSLNGKVSSLETLSPIKSSVRREVILEKLKFIDEVLSRYAPNKDRKTSDSLVHVPKTNVVKVDEEKLEQENLIYQPISSTQSTPVDVETATDRTGVLPRSIGRTINRIKQELNPESEAEIIKNYRTSKIKTVISIRFIVLLILVPILTHQIAKTFLVGPIVDRFRTENSTAIFLNVDLEEEAFMELERFEKELNFKSLIGLAPEIPKKERQEQIEEQVKEKAFELKEEYHHKSANAIKNVCADFFSLLAFAAVIFTNKKEIIVVKSFIDEIVYGLSDSAKAFIIILFTDIFVGFHSPHGWEVLLVSASRHLGIPENREFNGLFIATFPVILDTIFKYWIFRYLNKISPSAVATYKNMNE